MNTTRTSFTSSIWDMDSPTRRTRTRKLDYTVTKLVILWTYVREPLSAEFFKIRLEESNTLSASQFKVAFIKSW